jgi:phospholipase B1
MYYSTLLCLILLPLLTLGQFSTNCPILPAHNTTSIFDLRPNDISVMLAVGDSVTTGFGLLGSLNETRGRSFSMGGDPGAITLPNFFKYFNPALVGFSTGTYTAEVCHGASCPAVHYYPSQDANNAAKSGAMVFDMVSSQVNYLIRQVNQNPNMNVQTDWKVLTIMIGANDLCASCTFKLDYLSADEYESNLMGTLERIRTSLPRTFVNIVPGFNVSQAYDLSLTTPRCKNVSRPLFIQCDCLFAPQNGAIREEIDAHMTEYSQRANNIASYYQRKAYDDFAVVVQPFASNTHISDLPTRFISRLDCFHPSSFGQEAMAVALWNSMLTPAANKKTSLNMDDVPLCPTQETLIYTY